MYSIDHFLATPPVSAILSLLLIAGVDGLGVVLLRWFGFSSLGFESWQRWQAPVVGAMILGIILYPLVLASLISFFLMRFIAFFCIGVGGFHLTKFVFKFIKASRNALTTSIPHKKNPYNIILFSLIAGMVFVAMGPVTDADSLDYHMGVAISILNNGGMPVIPEWFSGRLAGNGEVLNALGIAVGAEQFGALLQLGGLMGITGLLLRTEWLTKQKDDKAIRQSTFITIVAISAPVLLSLITPKPQLLAIAMTTLAFALLIFPSRRNLSRKQSLSGFVLICLLVMCASQTKLTYLLGGGVIGLLALILMVRQKLFLPAIGIAVGTALLILLPPALWEYIYFNANIIEAITKPLPGNWPGTDAFELYLLSFKDSEVQFPLSLLLPKDFGTITPIIGIGIIFIFSFRPGRDSWLWTGMCAAAIVALTAIFLGPTTARSYLEPYFWIMILIALQPSENIIYRNKLLRLPFLAQSIGVILFYLYGAVTLFPGAITQQWRTAVMNRTANGYTVLKWADSILPANSILLNTHRSMALAPRDAVAIDWSIYVDLSKKESTPYIRRLKQKNPTYILITGMPPFDFGKLKPGVGKAVAGPCYGYRATRNPFNRGQVYEGWIFDFNASKL
jgi:hypothetical protein